MSAALVMGMTIVVVSSSTTSRRLEITVTSEQEKLIRQAADIRGVSLEEFMVASLESEAEETVRADEETTIKLSPRDSLIFAEAIINPGEPNGELRQLARDYERWITGIERE